LPGDPDNKAGYRPNAFEPETADAWEVGYKSTVADGQAQLSLTGFYYECEDLQVVVFDGGAASVENVGKVDSWGVEGTRNGVLMQIQTLY